MWTQEAREWTPEETLEMRNSSLLEEWEEVLKAESKGDLDFEWEGFHQEGFLNTGIHLLVNKWENLVSGVGVHCLLRA